MHSNRRSDHKLNDPMETLHLSPLPDKLEDVVEGFRASKALFTACELQIFDKLQHTSPVPQSAREISQAISSDLDATAILMDCLVALEFLEKTKKRDEWMYSNSEIASKYLTSSSPESQLGNIALKNNFSYLLTGNLEGAVREGTSQWLKAFGKSSADVFEEISGSKESRQQFFSGMQSSGLHGCYSLAKALDLSKYSTCCDLGGGVGTLAYALCHHHPHLKITVCDLESVVNASHHFRPSLEACPNQGNVSFAVEDFFKPDLPRADLYVLCRVLHDWPEDKIDLILSNVFNCSPSGGGLLICEEILNEDKTGPKLVLLRSLGMLTYTGGKERTTSEYKQLLEKHGFVDVQITLVPNHSLGAILCTKM